MRIFLALMAAALVLGTRESSASIDAPRPSTRARPAPIRDDVRFVENAGQMRGHTFHYSRLETPLAPVAWTVKHPSGAQGEAVYRVGSLTASYFHAFFASNPAAVASLLQGELE